MQCLNNQIYNVKSLVFTKMIVHNHSPKVKPKTPVEYKRQQQLFHRFLYLRLSFSSI